MGYEYIYIKDVINYYVPLSTVICQWGKGGGFSNRVPVVTIMNILKEFLCVDVLNDCGQMSRGDTK